MCPGPLQERIPAQPLLHDHATEKPPFLELLPSLGPEAAGWPRDPPHSRMWSCWSCNPNKISFRPTPHPGQASPRSTDMDEVETLSLFLHQRQEPLGRPASRRGSGSMPIVASAHRMCVTSWGLRSLAISIARRCIASNRCGSAFISIFATAQRRFATF